MIQLSYKQGNAWHMVIHGKDCVFTPMSLYIGNNLFPENPDCENGLRWRVNRKWVSYRQIRELIKSKRNPGKYCIKKGQG